MIAAANVFNSCEYIFPIKYIYSNNRSETLPVVSYWTKLI